MGNQTLVPSQIQSVESYFNELKTFIKFKSSLGSTTFMKTAIVSLNDILYNYELNDFLINKDLQQIKSILTSTNLNNESVNSNNTLTNNQVQQMSLNDEITQYLREFQHQVVVKVFPKYDLSIRFDLYGKRLRDIKQIIYTRYGQSTNCLPFSNLIITDKAAFLFRQYVKYNLYDRISTRPFLVDIEKKWIAFQIMCAVNEIHSLQVVHGDLKTENILINSFLWVSLTDFASYKPVYLSTNHPSADFNYYFDISRRRTCCLAPERFDQPSNNNNSAHLNTPLLPNSSDSEHMPPNPNDFLCSMDIFSLGCVIAELFMERPLFDFARLISYKEGKYDPKGELINEISDANIVDMIVDMISLSPTSRHTINEYLQEQNEKAFPSYFVFLKNYINKYVSIKQLTPDDVVLRLKKDLPVILKSLNFNLDSNTNQFVTNDAFLILLSLLLSVVRKLKYTKTKLISIELMLTFSKFLSDSIILDRIIPYLISFITDYEQQQKQPKLTTIPAQTTATKQQQTFQLYQQQHQQAIVKSKVINALKECLDQIKNIDLQNINIFPELIFGLLEKLSKDESYLVCSTIAKTISSFALTSTRYLESSYFLIKQITQQQQQQQQSHIKLDTRNQMPPQVFVDGSQNLSSSLTNTTTSSSSPNMSTSPPNNEFNVEAQVERGDTKFDEIMTYEKELENYQNRIMDIVIHLITDTSLIGNSVVTTTSTTNAVKEVLLRSDISRLCSFLGRQKTSDFLLPHMITILNEKTDWSIRAAFFDALCPVLINIGWESVEIVTPLLEQGLKDSEEFVIHRTLIALARMVDIGLFDRVQLRSFLADHVAPLLCHPSLWIRHGAVNFISMICQQTKKSNNNSSTSFTTADILCSIVPVINKYLKRTDLIEYDRPEILLSCLKTPLKRHIYEKVFQDVCRSDNLFLFLNERFGIRRLATHNNPPGYFDSPDPDIQALFEYLCKHGLTEEDEEKLLSMQDFISKTRMSRLSSSIHGLDSSSLTLQQQQQQPFRKENFIVKDGCISMFKDKILNSIDLSTRIIAPVQKRRSFISNDNNSEQQITSSTSLSTSPTVNNNDQISSNKKFVNSSINEWGISSSSSSSTPIIINETMMLIDESTTTNRHGHLFKKKTQQTTNTDTNENNCIGQFDNFINRSKLLYDDLKHKQLKIKQTRDTINSSTSSNLACLTQTSLNLPVASSSSSSSSSMINASFTQTQKWKPKGYLIVHSNEHTKNITKLCRNHDSSFFASCSAIESSVKLWSTENLLDGKSGYFKSRFTHDRFSGASETTNNTDTIHKPYCMTFFDNTSLGILTEDFSFYKIDFNSTKRVYQLYTDTKLFKNTFCDCYTRNKWRNSNSSIVINPGQPQSKSNYLSDKLQFYYLNRSFKSPNTCNCSNKYKNCKVYPTEMIFIDDFCPSWPVSVKTSSDYYTSSNVRGLFCYASNTGQMSCIDMRTRTKAFDLKHDLNKGFTTSIITDPWYTYLCLGTSNGCIDVYDFRFMQSIQSFQHRSKTSIVKMCSHPIYKNQIIASYQGNNEIAIWNLDSSSPSSIGLSKSQFKNNPEFTFWGATSVPPLSQKGISNEYISGLYGITSGVYDPANPNQQSSLICASTDMKIRYLDLNEPYRDSFIVSAPLNVLVNPNPKLQNTSNMIRNPAIYYEMRQIEGSKVLVELEQSNTGQQINLNNATQTSGAHSLGANSSPSNSITQNSLALAYPSYCSHHQDAISDLLVCYKTSSPAYQPYIVTSSRDGTLKVWR